jgi:hypothetical protein
MKDLSCFSIFIYFLLISINHKVLFQLIIKEKYIKLISLLARSSNQMKNQFMVKNKGGDHGL